jgi:hypothetical protein
MTQQTSTPLNHPNPCSTQLSLPGLTYEAPFGTFSAQPIDYSSHAQLYVPTIKIQMQRLDTLAYVSQNYRFLTAVNPPGAPHTTAADNADLSFIHTADGSNHLLIYDHSALLPLLLLLLLLLRTRCLINTYREQCVLEW